MSDTPSSGSGSSVDIASLGIEVDSRQPIQAAEAMDTLTKAADGTITTIDRLAEASKASAATMGENAKNTTTVAVSNEELAKALSNRSKATVTANDVMATANGTIKSKIQLLQEEWEAEQRITKLEQESLRIMEMENEARQAMILKLKDMVETYNMSTEALLRYRAAQLGVGEEAEVYIAQLEQMRLATEKYGVTITHVSQIEKARMEWEASNAAALNAQKNRELQNQINAELDAQVEMLKNMNIFEAFKRRTMAENRAEAMRMLEEQEHAAVALAEKQAMDEIRWNSLSVNTKIAELQRLQAYQSNSAIRPETIGSMFSQAAMNDLKNLPQYMQQYEESLQRVTKAHSSAHAPAKDLADGLSKISFESSRARSEVIVLAHEFTQGRFSRIPGSLMVLMEYTNAASLAFTGMGVVALATIATVGAVAYEMAKGAAEVYQFNNAMALTAGYSGMTRDSLESMAQSLKGNVHQQIGTATEMLVALNQSGKFTGDTLSSVAEAALKFQRLSGKSTQEVAGMFEQLGAVHGKVFNDMQNKIADWAAKMNESYHFLTSSQYEHIRLLALQGQNQEAITEVTRLMTKSFDESSEAMKNQDKNVGYLMASYLGFKMIIQDITHSMREWGKTDTTGQLLDAAKNQLRVTEAAAAKYATEDAASPTPGRGDSARKWREISAAYSKQVGEVTRLQKQFDDEQAATERKANEKRIDEEGVYGQREVDYVRKVALQKSALADNYIEHLMEGAAKANASAIQEWEKQYKGDAAHHDADMAAAIRNGTLKVETEETLQKTILDIRAKYHDKASSQANDGRKQELLNQLNADQQAYKLAQESADHSIKMAKDYADQHISSRQSEYDATIDSYNGQLRALDEMKRAELATLNAYKPLNDKDAAETQKRIDDVTRSYQLSAEEIQNAKQKALQDVIGKAVKEGTSDQSKAVTALDRQIEQQKKFNAEIGKTAEQKKQALADLDSEAILNAQIDYVYQQSIADNTELGDVQRAVAQAKADADQKEIDRLKTKRQLEQDAVGLEQQALIDKQWRDTSKKLEDDIANAIIDGGGRGWKRLIHDMELAFAKMILKPIIQPIAAGITNMIYPTATQGGGAAGGATGLIGAANAAVTAYRGLTGGVTSGIGSGVESFGNMVGSSSIADFGSGFSGSSAVVSELGQGTATGSMAAGDIAAANGTSAGYGAMASSATTIAAGIAGGLLAGHAISGEYKIAGSSNAAPMAGTAIGAYLGVAGGPIGMAIGAVIGGAIGGLLNRAFGMGDKNNTATGLRGTVSDSGVTGVNYSDWHQDGGWFRSDKNGEDTTALSADEVNSFSSGLTLMKSTVGDLAKTVGLGTDALDGYSRSFDILVTPLKEVKGNAAEQAQILADNQKISQDNSQKIADFFKSVGDDMATLLIPNISEFAMAGETASTTLERLNTVFKQTNDIAAMMGRSVESMFGGTGLSSDAARERLVNLAGGSSNLSAYTQSYAQNYLTEAEKLAPVTKSVADAMASLGYSSVTTREQFKATVSALDLTKESDAQLFISLMQLQDAFAAVHPAIEDTSKTVDQARSDLTDAYKRESDAIKATKDRMDSFAKTLKSLEASTLLGDLSPLTPEQKYAEAKSQFDDTARKAQAGDEDAQSHFQDAYQSFLEASRVVNASGDQYQKDFDYAQKVVDNTSDWASKQVDVAQASLDALNAEVSGLITVNDSVLSVHDAILELNKLLGTSATDKSSQNAITSLYQSILHRAPDAAGLDFWVDKLNTGTSLTDIGSAMASSPEGTGTDPIINMYQQMFNRDPDQAGLTYWENAYHNGTSLSDISSAFMSSSEYAQKLSSQSSSVSTTSSSNDVVVSAINDLKQEVADLRTDQNQQTAAVISSTVQSNEDNAEAIASATIKAATISQLDTRVQPA